MRKCLSYSIILTMFFVFVTGMFQTNKIVNLQNDVSASEMSRTQSTSLKGRHNLGKKLNSINIAMASDNNYAYPMLVAMTSALENKNPDTQINFCLMLSKDFDKSTREELLYLEKKYLGCKVNIIDMGDQLKDLYTESIKRITTAAYYRILLPAVTNLDKIVYLDVDSLILKDLSSLFNVDVTDCYLAAITNNRNALKWLEKYPDPYKKQFGTEDPYFCSGTLVMNLKSMRRDKLVPKLVDVASKNNLLLHDMDALNWVCHGGIIKIPRKYGSKKLNNDVVVLEFSGDNKPWKNRPNMPFADLWWSYAKKTRCFDRIKQKFSYKEPSQINKKGNTASKAA